MRILLVSATTPEIQPSLGILKKKGIAVAITGVGCAPALYHIVKAIQKHRPSLVVQAGIGGCFDPKYRLGEVLAVAEDYFGDIGVTENKQWQSVFEMGFIKPNQKPFKNGKLKNPHRSLLKASGLPIVPGVTINEISTNKQRIQLLQKDGVVIESMEGAALHYVALMEKIPFLQIRGISNYVGERNKRKWNFTDAIANVNAELIRCVNLLEQLTT